MTITRKINKEDTLLKYLELFCRFTNGEHAKLLTKHPSTARDVFRRLMYHYEVDNVVQLGLLLSTMHILIGYRKGPFYISSLAALSQLKYSKKKILHDKTSHIHTVK